jgi:hypothetical protein
MKLLRHFYHPSVPKKVSIHGSILPSDGMAGLGALEFLEFGSPDEELGLWSYIHRGTLTLLDIKVC